MGRDQRDSVELTAELSGPLRAARVDMRCSDRVDLDHVVHARHAVGCRCPAREPKSWSGEGTIFELTARFHWRCPMSAAEPHGYVSIAAGCALESKLRYRR